MEGIVMDYEKKYKEALERARISRQQLLNIGEEATEIEHIFPELKESPENEDEKVRKELKSFIQGILDCHDKPNAERDEKYQSWIAWLEKQGKNQINKLQVCDELYEHIRNTCACIDDALSSETLADINDYLSMATHSAQSAFDMIEKQREQKSSLEPKFKVGD